MKQYVLLVLERYLFVLAGLILAIRQPIIIGVTGSVGKTTTKEAIYHVLKEAGLSVGRTEANLNGDLGIALTVFGYSYSPAIWEWPWAFIRIHLNLLLLLLFIRPLPKYLVTEMGIDRIGDMERMLRVVHPKIGVVTWIGEGHHLEYLKDPETIAQEKGQILSALPKDGLAIISSSDPQAKRLRSLSSAPVKELSEIGLAASLETATCVADYLGVKLSIVEKALASFEQPKGRLVRLVGIHHSLLIDDSYNSSLPAVRLALDVLSHEKAKRKVAILGDLLEQGEQEQTIHETVAALAQQKADLFIAVGKRMKKVKSDHWFGSPDEAAKEIPLLVREGDVVIVKGSQGMRMEKISKVLANDSAEAMKKLPRQNLRWQQIPFGNP